MGVLRGGEGCKHGEVRDGVVDTGTDTCNYWETDGKGEWGSCLERRERAHRDDITDPTEPELYAVFLRDGDGNRGDDEEGAEGHG